MHSRWPWPIYASPSGVDKGPCSESEPCTPRGAAEACHGQPAEVCWVYLADGVYQSPEIDLFYYRFTLVQGNCSHPENVVLRGMTTENLITVQDHAIAHVRCMTLEAAPGVSGVNGIATRQHIILDYDNLIFGPMPDGTHLSGGGHSIANCVGPVWLTGGAKVHAHIADYSKLNLGCAYTLTNHLLFGWFINAGLHAIVAARGATFSGSATGVRCNQYKADVFMPQLPRQFPGDQDGNC